MEKQPLLREHRKKPDISGGTKALVQWRGYADRVDDKKSNIVEIYHDLTNGNAAPYRDFLEQVIEDSDEISVVQAATQLKNELDKAVSRPKESVIDQLKQISGQTVPSKMSHSFKEPER